MSAAESAAGAAGEVADAVRSSPGVFIAVIVGAAVAVAVGVRYVGRLAAAGVAAADELEHADEPDEPDADTADELEHADELDREVWG